jgi:hypothetical protein
LSEGAEIPQSVSPSEVSSSLLQSGRCHNGERHHLAARCDMAVESNAIPFRCKIKIITARYRGDLRTKDRMNMLQKNYHIKEKNKEI